MSARLLLVGAAAFICAVAGSHSVDAALIIDDFSSTTSLIFQPGPGTQTSGPISGPGILGTRNIGITVGNPPPNVAFGSAQVADGYATAAFTGVYSPANLSEDFAVSENFTAMNAPAQGLNSLDVDISSTVGTSITVTADGTSTYTFTDPVSLTGINHVITYSQFSNPAVFANLTSLTFVATFPNPSTSGPSVSFTEPVLLTSTTVPEPASIGLLVTSGLLLAGKRRRVR